MASRKKTLSQAELNALAERVQDLAREVTEHVGRLTVTDKFDPILEPVLAFNRMIEACSEINRVLVAIARAPEIERQIQRRIDETK